VTENLGDRIRAKRQRVLDVGEGAKASAKAHANGAVNALWVHMKNYIDGRIAKLAADNNLIDKP
jgi:hypothetical protein